MELEFRVPLIGEDDVIKITHEDPMVTTAPGILKASLIVNGLVPGVVQHAGTILQRYCWQD